MTDSDNPNSNTSNTSNTSTPNMQQLDGLADKFEERIVLTKGPQSKPISKEKLRESLTNNQEILVKERPNGTSEIVSLPKDRSSAPSVDEIAAEQPIRPQSDSYNNPSLSSNLAVAVPTKTKTIDAIFQDVSDSFSLPGMLRPIRENDLDSKETLILRLSQSLPLNTVGLPISVYRPDFVDPSQFSALRVYWKLPAEEGPDTSLQVELRNLEQELMDARIELSYDEGFPAISTTPLWEKLPWEPLEAYQEFQIYLAQIADNTYNQETEGRRLARMNHIPQDLVKSYYALYIWPLRVKCFELYKVAVHHQTKIRRALTLDDVHYRKAGKMLDTVLGKWDNLEAEKWDDCTPMDLLNMADKLIKIQRTAAGLGGLNSNTAQAQKPEAPSINHTFQQVIQHSGEEKPKQDILEEISQSPELLEQAQQLLIARANQEFGITPYQTPEEASDTLNASNEETETTETEQRDRDIQEGIDILG